MPVEPAELPLYQALAIRGFIRRNLECELLAGFTLALSCHHGYNCSLWRISAGMKQDQIIIPVQGPGVEEH